MYFVYMTTNNVNGKRYIGKRAGNPEGRERNYLGSGKYLKLAIEKYGRENFSREVLITTSTEEENRDAERLLIEQYDAVNSPDFYNICEGAGGGWKYEWTEERRQIASERMREWQSSRSSEERKPTAEKTAKVSARIKELWKTDEYRNNKGTTKGQTRTYEQKRNISEGLLKRNYQHSEETRKKLSDAAKARRKLTSS